MQKKQREFQSGWDAEEAAKKLSDEDFESDEDDDEEQKVEKRKMREARDLYGDDQRLDVEVETEIEREQRGGDVVDEEDDNEDVSIQLPLPNAFLEREKEAELIRSLRC